MESKIQEAYKQAHTQTHDLAKNTRGHLRPFIQKTLNLNVASSQMLAKYTPALKAASTSAEADLEVLTSHLFTPQELEEFRAIGIPDHVIGEMKETLLQLKTLALTAEKKRADSSPEGLEAAKKENAALKIEMGIADYKVCDLKQMLSRAIGLLEKNGISVKPLFEG